MSSPTDLHFPSEDAARLIAAALAEDLGPQHRDVTTMATIPREQQVTAQVIARGPGVFAGGPIIAATLAAVAEFVDLAEPSVDVRVAEGTRITRGDVLAEIRGPAQVVLIAERTVLNIISRLSGVASHTRRWADALAGTDTLVLDTRKTTPGMRLLEKYAVRAGGGTNKRFGLYDVAMIKDNHKLAAGSISAAYRLISENYPDVDIQVEVTTADEALEAYGVGARFIMCDNMSPEVLRETVQALRAQPEPVEVEATGGLTLEVVREYADTGVDFVSVGGLTHSSPIVDIALDFV